MSYDFFFLLLFGMSKFSNAGDIVGVCDVNVVATLCYVPFWVSFGFITTVTMMPDTAGSWCIIILIQ